VVKRIGRGKDTPLMSKKDMPIRHVINHNLNYHEGKLHIYLNPAYIISFIPKRYKRSLKFIVRDILL
jgi:hypothetical protein